MPLLGADQEVRHINTEESVLFLNGSNVFAKNFISNFAMLSNSRMSYNIFKRLMPKKSFKNSMLSVW